MARKKGTQTRTEYGISQTKFVETWESSNSPEEVAEKLEMPKPVVIARASKYRKAGVKLKKMGKKSRRSIDVEALNRMIDEMRAKSKKK
jgi:hypothetical protein